MSEHQQGAGPHPGLGDDKAGLACGTASGSGAAGAAGDGSGGKAGGTVTAAQPSQWQGPIGGGQPGFGSGGQPGAAPAGGPGGAMPGGYGQRVAGAQSASGGYGGQGGYAGAPAYAGYYAGHAPWGGYAGEPPQDSCGGYAGQGGQGAYQADAAMAAHHAAMAAQPMGVGPGPAQYGAMPQPGVYGYAPPQHWPLPPTAYHYAYAPPAGAVPAGGTPMGAAAGQGRRAGMAELIEELGKGGNGLSSLTRMLNLDDSEFWKGALVGAAAVLLLTNESVQDALFKTGARAKGAVEGGIDKIKERAQSAKTDTASKSAD